MIHRTAELTPLSPNIQKQSSPLLLRGEGPGVRSIGEGEREDKWRWAVHNGHLLGVRSA